MVNHSSSIRRRFFQYSLRFLLLIVLVFAIAMAWLTRGARLQEAAVVRLTSYGASHIGYVSAWREDGSPDYRADPKQPKLLRDLLGRHYFETVVGVGAPADDRVLPSLVDLPALRRLTLWRGQFVRPQFDCLQSLRELRSLCLESTNVTDDALAYIGTLYRLEELDLNSTHITDRGLTHLGALSRLRLLVLNNTEVTGATFDGLPAGVTHLILDSTNVDDIGLARLSGLRSLKVLSLIDTNVTGVGITHLTALEQLTTLDICNTAVGDEATAALFALPQKVDIICMHTTFSVHCLRMLGFKHLIESDKY